MSFDPALVTVLGATFFIVVALTPVVRRWALSFGFVDKPGGRKRHEDAVPPIGGLVVFSAFIVMSIGWLFFQEMLDAETLWFFVALALLVVTGALDDRYNLAPRVKFLIQFVAAFILVFPADGHLANLGNNLFGFGPFWLGFMMYPFAIMATVLLINAVNLMDGLDGLAGGKGVIILGGLTVSALWHGGHALVPLLLILIVALIGFLFFNMRFPWRARASVFMGDAGSLTLGASLAWFSFHLAHDPDIRVIEPISVAWLLALPIYDICGQFARRMSEGRHPFDADAHHFHHHFIHEGVSVSGATLRILGLVFLCAVIGIGGVEIGVPVPVLTYSWIILLLVHIYLSLRPMRMQRLIRFFAHKKAI